MVCKLTILIITLVWAVTGYSQSGGKSRNFETVLKFAACVNWPEETEKGDLTIYIADSDDERFRSAVTYLMNCGFKNQKIQPVRLDDKTEIPSCGVVFINQDAKIDFNKLTEKISGKGIMTITTDKALLEAGCMFYINAVENEELEYLFNKRAVIESQLSITSLLFDPDHKWTPTEY
jgi:hypothetical protein